MKKIYILHGWSYSTEKWQPFLELLKKDDYEPIFLHIPGLTTELKEVWKLENYVEWLKKNLDTEKEKVQLLGHSNGGRIALAYAEKYPSKIEKLILIDSAGIYHNEFPLRMKRFVFGFLAKTGKKVTRSPQMRKIFYKFIRERDYEKADPILRETMKNLISVDLFPLLKNIAIQTIIIWGKEDKVTPVNDAFVMKNEIKNSRLYLIDGAGHSPQFTNAKEVAEKLIG